MSDNSDNTNTRSPETDVEIVADLHPPSPVSGENHFSRLPFETVEEIFLYADPVINLPATPTMRKSRESEIDPWTISAVCKQWSAIALLNPSLWATIKINATQVMRSHWKGRGFSQLRSCLERSGAHPLDICINGNDIRHYTKWDNPFSEAHQNSNVLLPKVLDMVMLHSERWKRMTFSFPWRPEYSARFDTLDGRLPLLEHLEIDLSKTIFYKGLPTTGFLSSPQLKSVGMIPSRGREALQKILMPKTQISEVTFGGGQWDHENALRELLGFLSVSLKALEFSQPITLRYMEWTIQGPEKFTLTQLQRLSFPSDCEDILEMLICPSLEELEIDKAHEYFIIQFLDRSSCALTCLNLFSPTQNILRHKSLSTLTSLGLKIDDELMMDLLNFDSHHLFPSLTQLGIYLQFKGHDDDAEHLCSQVQGLQRMVDSRTRSMKANQPEFYVDGLQSDKFQQDPSRSFLEEIAFLFELEDCDCASDEEDCWDVEPILALESFCISRGILISLTIEYW